ncbi:cold-shock protein [Pseudorhodobacter aquimaris]|uniref:cold-shock protein n=1 Tax=Pseudorhodobacter aquimaris TaxID=687412 RepID=UPI00067B6527|nr:cold shock domain-containing protein [Pseudorhodobacter aquimaris]
MNDDDEMPLQVLHGRVKWFDPVKGFGFILSDDVETDVLLHANVLRNFGQSTVADGADITVTIQSTQRGVQAVEVLSIVPPEGSGFLLAGDDQTVSAEAIAALPLEPARVKWFDKGKGFGFANVFGRPEDVFVHVEVLRTSGFADLTAGEAIALRIVDSKRGRMAAQVLAWDSGLRAPK